MAPLARSSTGTMPPEVVESYPELRRAAVAPDTFDTKARTVEITWSTGARALKRPWFSDPFLEELDLREESIRLDRINAGGPVLDSHARWSLENQIGVVERAWVASPEEMRALVRFGVRDEVEWVRREVEAGTFQNISFGYWVWRYLEVGQTDEEVPILRAVDWEPFEISFLPVPADFEAGTRSAEELEASFRDAPLWVRRPLTLETRTMPPEDPNPTPAPTPPRAADPAPNGGVDPKGRAPDPAPTPPAPPAPPPVDVDALRREGAQAERTRVAAISAACLALPAETRAASEKEWIADPDVTVEQVRSAIIEKLAAASDEDETSGTHATVGDAAASKRMAAIEDAIAYQVRAVEKLTVEGASDFEGMPLSRVAEEMLLLRGATISSRSPARVVDQILGFGRPGSGYELVRDGAGMTPGDFPQLLANVANKSLQMGYEASPRTFTSWASRSTSRDFKPVSRPNIGLGSPLLEVPTGAEVKYGALTEVGETYTLADYARIFALDRKAILNDDLDAFGRFPRAFGEKAAILEGDVVYALLTGNVVLSDGDPLFDAAHANTVAAGIDVAGLSALRVLMREQTEPDGANLNLTPRHLIVPPEFETAAQQLLTTIQAQQVGQVNPFQGSMESAAAEPRLTDPNDYYVFASPNQRAAVEYAYLSGEEGPQTMTRTSFERLGFEIRVVLAFAAGVLDFRGAARATA